MPFIFSLLLILPLGTVTPLESGFLDNVSYDSISLGPGYDRPYQFNPNVREAKSIQLYKHLNLKSCIWTFDAYYDMTELIDICGGSVTADFQVRSVQFFLNVRRDPNVEHFGSVSSVLCCCCPSLRCATRPSPS